MFAASWTDNDILGAQMALLRKQVENVWLQVKDKAAEMVSGPTDSSLEATRGSRSRSSRRQVGGNSAVFATTCIG